jgi:hypothetical protein
MPTAVVATLAVVLVAATAVVVVVVVVVVVAAAAAVVVEVAVAAAVVDGEILRTQQRTALAKAPHPEAPAALDTWSESAPHVAVQTPARELTEHGAVVTQHLMLLANASQPLAPSADDMKMPLRCSRKCRVRKRKSMDFFSPFLRTLRMRWCTCRLGRRQCGTTFAVPPRSTKEKAAAAAASVNCFCFFFSCRCSRTTSLISHPIPLPPRRRPRRR